VDEAIEAHAGHAESRYIGGGTNLVDLMKMGVERPSNLIDISRLPLNTITEHKGGVRIGAIVSNTAAAGHPLIRDQYPVLSQAILAGASQQLRNMATMGGNLLQRTRCYYFLRPHLRGMQQTPSRNRVLGHPWSESHSRNPRGQQPVHCYSSQRHVRCSGGAQSHHSGNRSTWQPRHFI
jgi:CO/xanthine dehydrogenase FAD-binding subunit